VVSGLPNIALRYVQRQVLLLSLILLVLSFVVTAAMSRTYHVREAALVQEWFRAGEQDMSAGRPEKALEDFRNALAYDPENNLVQLRLAEALLAGGRLTEARSYLANLWDRSPGSGEVNLDLAHVSMRMGDTEQAIRYFRGAIYGSWDSDPALQRRKTRRELYEFLVLEGRSIEAQAELAGLAADTPASKDNQ
jgi:predicted Zn-dependent protease